MHKRFHRLIAAWAVAVVAGAGLVPDWQGGALMATSLPEVRVVPGGQSIGVVVRSDGVTVVDESAVPGPDGRPHRPGNDAGLRPGDVILAINGRDVQGKEEAARLIDRAARGGRPVDLRVRRGDALFQVRVRPVWDPRAGRYLIGLWIRDGASGIGTLSFYDPESRAFAALGHVVADPRSGTPLAIAAGLIVPTSVRGIERAGRGHTGEKVAALAAPGAALGEFTRNTDVGIFGHLERLPAVDGVAVPVAPPGDVRTGPARMLTVVEGQRVASFDVVIERTVPQARPAPKGLVVRVSDPRLLRATGGIVQGMSGSPVLQDGRLVAVVTHVFVNDPSRGYAVYAYWMAIAAGMARASAEAPGE